MLLIWVIVNIVCIVIIGFIVNRWFGRKDKTVGDIIVTEKEDGGFIFTFTFDNYDDPRKIKDLKQVVFKVVRASSEDSS